MSKCTMRKKRTVKSKKKTAKSKYIELAGKSKKKEKHTTQIRQHM